jgi:ABC-type sugar transport system substrate-binding protein
LLTGHSQQSRETFQALEKAGRTALYVADLTPVSLDALQAGQITAVFQRDPVAMGVLLYEIAKEYLESTEIETMYVVPVTRITQETLDEKLQQLFPRQLKE